VSGSILGNRVLRKEDPKFLTTGGRYVDDLHDEPLITGAAFVTYVRSTVAHALITGIDTSAAEEMPGVIAVFTAENLGLQPEKATYNPNATRTLLASGKTVFVGEPIAAIVTELPEQGEDAAEQVIVDYDFLEALIDMEEAMTSSTLIFEAIPNNVVFDTAAIGMPDVTDDSFFEGCEVVVDGRFVNQRVAPCPLEVRGCAATWHEGRLIQWTSTQHAQGARKSIANANGVDESLVRVITPDVGGGFGAKIGTYPEEVLLGTIAKRIERPVRWRETRSESMVALGHGRAQVQYVRIGGSRDGKVRAVSAKILQDSGAWVDVGAVLAPFMTRPMLSGVYDIERIECRTISVATNTTPTVAYRGAGRPEATALIERAMDLFAHEIGLDPVDVRRTNLIAPFTEPHTTAIGQEYDVGNYERALDLVLERADYSALRAEQRARRERGDSVQVGIGVSTYVEITAGTSSGETARVEVLPSGKAIVYTGTSPHGQGHVTSWAMILNAETGIALEDIDVVWGDTDVVPVGGGTMGSRSLQLGGAAVQQAAVELVTKAKDTAAHLLEASSQDIVFDVDGALFHVAGTPARSVTWREVATAVSPTTGIAHDTTFVSRGATFPFGAHLAVVEVDTETGKTTLVRHVACDDAGTVLNPLILEGQIHGGIAQGAAQALLEEVRYDDGGNPITSNLADYAFISSAELPSFEVVHMETPTPRNPLGAKGIGESGTIGSTPAIQSAVVDALAHLGVRHVDMPATSERVWRAITSVTA
jgi:carbon-monoxide dehydrogenase large subunit